MNEDCLKLTIYFGEHERVGHELLSDALLDIYQRHELEAAVLLRGIEGFGLRHTLHTQRLLTLSEDLPLVSMAVDTRAKVEAALDEVKQAVGKGLITVERARMVSAEFRDEELPEELHETTKLTVYCGRDERSGNTPTYRAVVDLLREHGVAGATTLLGVDGMRHGVRHRARFFSRNQDVPLMIVSIGEGSKIAAALADLRLVLARPLLTLERVGLCKRDGVKIADPSFDVEVDDAGLAVWQKLMVYASEQARHRTHPLYAALIRRLRREGAPGATAMRGIWGYSGDHAPHGETLLSLRRTVPVVTVLIDRPHQMERWWAIVDEMTDEAGLVTSEYVPAFQAVTPAARTGGLRPARLRR